GKSGRGLVEMGQLETGLKACRQERELFAALARERPDEPAHQYALAASHNALGYVLDLKGNHDQGRAENAIARGLVDRLIAEHPDVRDYLLLRVYVAHNAAPSLLAENKHEQALRTIDEALAFAAPLAKGDKAEEALLWTLTMLYGNRGSCLQMLRRDGKEAEAALTRAADLCRELLRRRPRHTDYRDRLARTLANLGTLHLQQKQLDRALA